MKMDGWDRKLRRLERKMDVTDFQPGSTKIAWECLTKPERVLFTKIHKVLEEYGANPPDDIMQENHELLLKAGQIINQRTMDLFVSSMNCLLRNNLEKMIFWSRYVAFLTSTMNIVEMRRREEEQEAQFKEKYGPDWIDRVQEEYGDDWPEPDYSGLGEMDFNEALKSRVGLNSGRRTN